MLFTSNIFLTAEASNVDRNGKIPPDQDQMALANNGILPRSRRLPKSLAGDAPVHLWLYKVDSFNCVWPDPLRFPEARDVVHRQSQSPHHLPSQFNMTYTGEVQCRLLCPTHSHYR